MTSFKQIYVEQPAMERDSQIIELCETRPFCVDIRDVIGQYKNQYNSPEEKNILRNVLLTYVSEEFLNHIEARG